MDLCLLNESFSVTVVTYPDAQIVPDVVPEVPSGWLL